jgi:hypothetical protein
LADALDLGSLPLFILESVYYKLSGGAFLDVLEICNVVKLCEMSGLRATS